MGRISNRDGFVMIAVIFALTIMSVLAVAALWVANDDHRASRAMRESGAALFAAEAGVNYVFGHWTDTYAALVAGLQSGDSLAVAKTTLNNRASYAGVIYRVHPTGGQPQYAVTVEGRSVGSSGGRRSIRVVITSTATGGLFKGAVFSQGLLKMGGSGNMSDSYDHRNGPYNAATAGTNGDLFTNGDADLSSSTILKGDITAAGVASIGNPGGVTGTVTQGAPPLPPYPVLDCPTGGYTPASYIPIGGPGGAKSYDPVLGKLIIGSGNNLILSSPPPGGTYYFSYIDAGGGPITINGGQHVNIIIDDKLTVGSGGLVNTGADPTALSVSSCGSPVKPSAWSITGGAGAYFTIYAPNHDVVVGGGGDLWGAVIGGTVSATGGSKFHYDEALGAAGGNGQKWTVLPGSWTQLSL